MLEILLKMHDRLPDDDDDDDGDGLLFWLIVADQFERRGIACRTAFSKALAIIESERDLRRLESHGLDKRNLEKRRKILQELSLRLHSPRPVKPRLEVKKLPDHVVAIGEVYTFPTMAGKAMNAWFETWEQAGFVPDGWGAYLIVAQGRVFDWFPWCAVASLSTNPEQRPSLKEAAESTLLPHSLSNGAPKCVPRKSHLQRMGAQLIGRLLLDPIKAGNTISSWSDEKAVECGWSFSSAAYSGKNNHPNENIAVADLLQASIDLPAYINT